MVLKKQVVEREDKRTERPFPFLRPELTLPDGDAVPAHLCQLLLLLAVAFLVAVDFLGPEVNVCPRHTEVLAALMPMPEAPIDEHARPILAQNDVGMAWQPWVVQPVSEPLTPQELAHDYLRLRVLGANTRHIV